MNKVEIAYLAGIIDGEGCISFASRLKKYITPSLQITNTYKPLIDWLHSTYGGYVYERVDKRINGNRKTSWLFVVFGRKATQIISSVRPYLKIKCAQADLVTKLYRARDIKRDKLGRLCSTLTKNQLNENKKLLLQMRTLNKRGIISLSYGLPLSS